MAASHFSGNHYGTVSIDLSSIATVSRGSFDVTVTGIAPGDLVVFYPPEAINDDLVYAGCRITAVNTVRLYRYNPTAGAIDDTARTWEYTWIDLT
jgi:hypothetical protein